MFFYPKPTKEKVLTELFFDKEKRRRHLYIIGKTGMGKTTLLETLIFSDIQRGEGLAIIDAHGDLSERVLEFIPSFRINDVCYFNPQDRDFPISFNLLKNIGEKDRDLVCSGIIAIFRKLWPEFWGPRSEHIMRNLLLGLLEKEKATFLYIPKILADSDFRKKWARKIKDPVVKDFWQNEFESWSEKLKFEATAPLQNKIGQLLTNPLIRNIICQPKRKVNLRKIMDNKGILLVNLSKGAIGEDASSLLGSMLVILLQTEVMKRIDQPIEERKDFNLYIDEFQSFTTEAFCTILSEARKFRLNLVLSHQYLGQLDNNLRKAILGNVGNLIVFQISGEDEQILMKEFSSVISQVFKPYMTALKRHEILVKLADTEGERPVTFLSPPPLSVNYGQKEKIIRVCRQKYCQNRLDIELKIKKFLQKR
jgi:energy-coupling factor transporter ATP-binding protein EcfA2